MLYTTNLNLKKPELTDYVDIRILNENADALDTAINNKVDKVAGKQLSTEDYSTAEKTKLTNLPVTTYDRASAVLAGANVFSNIVVTDGIVTSLATRALTATDLSLGSVMNYGIATQAEAEAGTSDVKYMTPLKTKQAIFPTDSFMAFATNANADSLDAAFGKNNTSIVLDIPRQLAMYGNFKGSALSFTSLPRNISFVSLLQNYPDIFAYLYSSSYVAELTKLSPYAKSVISAEVVTWTEAELSSRLSTIINSGTNYTTIASLTAAQSTALAQSSGARVVIGLCSSTLYLAFAQATAFRDALYAVKDTVGTIYSNTVNNSWINIGVARAFLAEARRTSTDTTDDRRTATFKARTNVVTSGEYSYVNSYLNGAAWFAPKVFLQTMEIYHITNGLAITSEWKYVKLGF